VTKPALSWFLLLACNLMWALQFTCVKLVEDQVGTLFTVWAPMALATLWLYPLVRRERASGGAPAGMGGDWRRFALLALFGAAPGQVLATWGTRLSTAANAAVMQLTLPVSTAVLAVLLLNERMNAARWLSFAVAGTGVVLCSQVDLRGFDLSSRYLAGNLLVFGGTLGSAFYNSYGKSVLRRYSPLQMLFGSYVATLVILTPLVVFTEAASFAQVPEFTLRTWTGMAILALFHNFLSMVLFLKALKELDAIQTALCNYLITFFGVPIAVLWLGERPTLGSVAGGVLIIAGTLLVALWSGRCAETPEGAGA
jgi:drug/metabolite transporter (DMT)-like permease